MNQCEIVRDLLPLYVDGVSSGESARLVKKHCAKCAKCARLLEQLGVHRMETSLRTERDSVVSHQARAAKRKSFQVGAILSAILMVPVLVCLIVNLATGHGLDWFFIVLTALLVFGSLTVVPLVAERRKFSWTLGAFSASLMLLLLTCCIYTQGDWFFVAASSSLFGLALVFLPFSLRELPLGRFWGHHKGLLALGMDTLLFALMMFCIGLFTGTAAYWRTTLAIAPYFLGMIWISFLWFRYVRINGFCKAGVFTAALGVFTFCADTLCGRWMGETIPWPVLNLARWDETTLDGNVTWLFLLGCCAVGLAMVVIGTVRSWKQRKN